jgi:hypothetical protein
VVRLDKGLAMTGEYVTHESQKELGIEEFDTTNFGQYIGCWINDHNSRKHRNSYEETSTQMMNIALTLGVPHSELPHKDELFDLPDGENEASDYDYPFERIELAINNHLNLDHLFWGWVAQDPECDSGKSIFGLWPKGTEYYPNWREEKHEYCLSYKAFETWVETTEEISHAR